MTTKNFMKEKNGKLVTAAANSGFALCGQFGSLANLSYF
jgi:hypothetical protein